MLGILEPIDTSSIVRWDPNLAAAPPTGRVVTVCDMTTSMSIGNRTAHLGRLTRRLEQVPGVSCAVQPRSPVTVLLTPGPTDSAIDSIRSQFPGSLCLVRRALGEFPGGVQLIATDQVCAHPQRYADALANALRTEDVS